MRGVAGSGSACGQSDTGCGAGGWTLLKFLSLLRRARDISSTASCLGSVYAEPRLRLPRAAVFLWVENRGGGGKGSHALCFPLQEPEDGPAPEEDARWLFLPGLHLPPSLLRLCRYLRRG